MSLRIANVRLSVDEPESALPGRLAGILGLAAADLPRWRILRKSLDARDQDDLQFVYTAEVALPADEARVAALARGKAHPAARIDLYEEAPSRTPPGGAEPLPGRPVVVGSGPGGLVAAYFLAEQ